MHIESLSGALKRLSEAMAKAFALHQSAPASGSLGRASAEALSHADFLEEVLGDVLGAAESASVVDSALGAARNLEAGVRRASRERGRSRRAGAAISVSSGSEAGQVVHLPCGPWA